MFLPLWQLKCKTQINANFSKIKSEILGCSHINNWKKSLSLANCIMLLYKVNKVFRINQPRSVSHIFLTKKKLHWFYLKFLHSKKLSKLPFLSYKLQLHLGDVSISFSYKWELWKIVNRFVLSAKIYHKTITN